MISPSYERRNFRLGILHRVLAGLGQTLADPSLVLALLVRQLGGSNALVGLLSTIRYGSFLLPQLIVAGRIEDKPRKAPYYVKAELTRATGYAIIALAILAITRASMLLPVFFILFVVSYLAHGASSVPGFDVVSKVIPPSQRNTFFAQRNFWAGVTGFGAGLVVRQILATGSGPPPVTRYAWLILLAAMFFALATLVFSAIVEPGTPTKQQQISWWQHLFNAPGLLARNKAYRRLTSTLVLMAVGQRLADGFYIVYATEVLGVPAATAGIYLSALVFSKIVSNLFWDRLSRGRPNRVTLQWSAAAALAIPLAALGVGSGAPRGVFLLVFLLMGVRDSGKNIGKRSVLLDIVPAAERPTYWGLLNTVLGVVSFLPVLAGQVIDWVGYQPVFGLVAGLALLAWLSSQRLE